MRTFGLFLLVLLCGCGGPAIETKKVAFVLPTGWTKGASDDQLVELGIPSGWRQGVDRMMESPMLGAGSGLGDIPVPPASSDPNASDASKSIEQLSNAMTEMSNEAEREALERLKKKRIILNVISTGARPTIGEARTRYYVQRYTQGGNWNWDSAHANERDHYLHKPVARELDLPTGKAHRMEETKTLVDGGTYTIISYLIPNGKDLYALRFITQEQATVIQSIEKQVAESIRIN
jgi:hypothetical protein